MAKTQKELTEFTKLKIAEITGLKFDDIDENTELGNLGLDSVRGLFIMQELEDFLDIEINPLIFYNYPTINLLSDYLSKDKK